MSTQGAGGLGRRGTSAAIQQQARQEGQQGAGGVASPVPLKEPAEGGPPRPEPLLPGSSEEDDAPAPAAPALTAEEAARRKRRREQWEAEQEGARRWDLARRLAAISSDVEFLAREVGAAHGAWACYRCWLVVCGCTWGLPTRMLLDLHASMDTSTRSIVAFETSAGSLPADCEHP